MVLADALWDDVLGSDVSIESSVDLAPFAPRRLAETVSGFITWFLKANFPIFRWFCPSFHWILCRGSASCSQAAFPVTMWCRVRKREIFLINSLVTRLTTRFSYERRISPSVRPDFFVKTLEGGDSCSKAFLPVLRVHRIAILGWILLVEWATSINIDIVARTRRIPLPPHFSPKFSPFRVFEGILIALVFARSRDD